MNVGDVRMWKCWWEESVWCNGSIFVMVEA